MKRRIFVATMSALLGLTLGLPQMASAHDFKFRPRIAISKIPKAVTDPGERVLVVGDIKGKRLCARRRVVSLFRVTPGADDLLGTDRSDREGEFRFALHPDDDMFVYARIGRLVKRGYEHRHVCRPSKSERQPINVVG